MPIMDAIGASGGGALTLAQLTQTLDSIFGQNDAVSTDVYPSVAIVSNAAPNVLGAYAQITANAGANPQVIKGVWVRLSSASVDYEMEIAVGAAGFEVVVYRFSLRCGVVGDIQYVPMDVRIAGAQRIAMRQRDSNGGLTSNVLPVWKEGA